MSVDRAVAVTDEEAVRIIEGLGGTSAAARFFDISQASVSEWKRKGVPQARKRHLRDVRPDLLEPRGGDIPCQ
jgi:hypothetical protein